MQDGADVNVKDEDGAATLHCSALKNSAAVAKKLLKKGAEVNAQS